MGSYYPKIISIRTIIFLLAIIAGILALLYYLRTILTPFILAIFLAYLLSPVVDLLERKGLNRAFSILLLFLGFAFLLFLLIYFLYPLLVEQLKSLQQDFPNYIEQLKKYGEYWQKRLEKIIAPTSGESQIGFEGNLTRIVENTIKVVYKQVINIFSFLPLLILIPFITFFFLKDGRAIKKMVINLVPNRYFEMALTLLYEIDLQIGRYIRGQLLDCFVIALLYTIGLLILKIDYFFILGAFAGIANIIPYVGPLAGAIPAIIVAEVGLPTFSYLIIIKIIILSVAVQIIDNVLVAPLVVGKSINLHPLIIILALFIGGNLLGLLGMLVAVPVAGMLKVTLEIIQQRFRDYAIV